VPCSQRVPVLNFVSHTTSATMFA